MNPGLEMSWSCPGCRARQASVIAPDAEAGKIVDVSCRACGKRHEASILSRSSGTGAAMTVGVVWI